MATAKQAFGGMTEERIDGPNGLKLFVRSWHPTGPARGVVAIVPGFNSHSGYYSWVGQQFVADGLAAYAVDLHGRGKSEGERFYVNSFFDYVDDVHALVRLIEEREPGLPLVLLGHSAGGVVSCLYALDYQVGLAGFICESFAFQLPAPQFALAVLKGLSHAIPHAHVLRLKNRDFSRDPTVVEAMNEDPLIANEAQPTNSLAAMVRADERLKNEFPLISLPLLILHGTGDKAAQFSGSKLFYDSASSVDKTLKLYEGHYHDLLNDVGKETVMDDIKSWVNERMPQV